MGKVPRVALGLAAVVLVASLFAAWSAPGEMLVLFGSLDRLAAERDALERTGWEELTVLDVALAALAAVLLALAVRRVRARPVLLGAAAAVGAAIVAVAVAGLGGEKRADDVVIGGNVVGAAGAEVALAGPLLALVALGTALVALLALAARWGRTTL